MDATHNHSRRCAPMNLTDEAPKLTPWPFIVGDAVLLGLAAFIASQSPSPLTGAPLIAIVGCVGLGAVLACIPFLLNYTRRQDLALAERQNEIAALARTTSESAEQIGIVAQGLQSITDATQRALKPLDHLPQKLQEKINEFKIQLNEVNISENEALAQEVNTLRTSEIERLEAAFASVRKTAAELAALETTTRQHLADLNQTIARFATAAEHSASETHAALNAGRDEASRAISVAQKAATTAFENAVANAILSLESHVSRVAAVPVASPPAIATPREAQSAAEPESPVTMTGVQPLESEQPPAFERPPETSHVTSQPPFHAPKDSTSSTPSLTGQPFPAARKRPPRKSIARDDDQVSLGLELAEPSLDGEYSQLPPEDNTSSSAVSSDGLTRLLVTAYIGIGNKLFVRGDGPGLSWEKGVPLQFVSIGKWRWETADAVEPLTVKLYKNDEQECTALGTINVDPGHQQEVRASF
jgi:hypothetical protein